MRLFIGIPLPQDVKRTIEDVKLKMKKDVKASWTPSENYHITLKFIGEADMRTYRRACAALNSVEFKPFNAKLSGVGKFGNLIWCGVKSSELELLADKVGEALRPSVSFDDKPFATHITFARRADKFIKVLPDEVEFTIDKIVLFESVKRPGGGMEYVPRYTKEAK